MSTCPPTNKRAKVDFELMGCRILALPYRHYFSEFAELYEMHKKFLALPQWKDGAADCLGVNERLAALLLGLERQKATQGLVVISILDFLDLFKEICPATLDVAGQKLEEMDKAWTRYFNEGM